MLVQTTESSVGRVPTTGNAPDWRVVYSRRLLLTDLLVLVWVVVGVQFAWFGLGNSNVGVGRSKADLAVSYSVISVLLILGWMATLAAYGSRGFRLLGTGSDEYRVIAGASVRFFGLVAVVAYLFHIDLARGYILIALPTGVGMLMLSRWLWRQWLVAARSRGEFTSRVVLVGSRTSTARIHRELLRQPGAGYWVVGACIPGAEPGEFLPGSRVPVVGSLDAVHLALESLNADTVVLTGTDALTPQGIRRLSWSLEPGLQHLVVAPRLIDIGGPRIHIRPVSGLPLIHVETPSHEGSRVFVKRAMDLLTSGLLVVVLAPVLLGIALVIRLDTRGPVLTAHTRVGLRGKRIRMFRFRTERADIPGTAPGAASPPTRVGRFLRRWSLDELPQLFNVVAGTMALVGPRPALETEFDLTDRHAQRKFLVKPGMTGLRQTYGRTTLSREESLRLDLYYAENWSVTGDFVLLRHTARTVLRRARPR